MPNNVIYYYENKQELYKQLGTSEVLFLFTDAHVVEEGFLEYLNNMLTTGTYVRAQACTSLHVIPFIKRCMEDNT